MNIGMMILGMAFMIVFIRGCFTTGTSAPVTAMWLLLALLLLHWSKQVFRTHCWLRKMKRLGAGTPREQQALRRNIFCSHAYGLGVILITMSLADLVETGDIMAEADMITFSVISVLFYSLYRMGIRTYTASLRTICRRQK